ncbi:alpha-1,2-fucosyltransferase [Pedobacter gandavensis]|uniref:alpha-1,2-fucosyltransferase n=1 Tax=Pedobacter gandavensis TaxID=2679963 RepID=UPI00292D0C49|nr:alpha-1,2-fucosyltransferase [Pedobacter gandavensis]
MIVIQHVGGLGNQMFQYAFGRYLSIKYKIPLFLDIHHYTYGHSNRNFDLEMFKLREVVIGEGRVLIKDHVQHSFRLKERQFHFDKQAFNILDGFNEVTKNQDYLFLLRGYWQSYKYFDTIKDVIKKDFEFKRKLSGKWLELSKEIAKSNAVMINVRRGDYLQNLDYHGVVDEKYLFKAMKVLEKRVENPVFYVFSDDISWCRSHLIGYSNLHFVDERYYDEKFEFYLQLMTCCKHFIISNSTFSWWGAWLSKYQNKIVIAPKKWFVADGLNAKDLIPKDWMKI